MLTCFSTGCNSHTPDSFSHTHTHTHTRTHTHPHTHTHTPTHTHTQGEERGVFPHLLKQQAVSTNLSISKYVRFSLKRMLGRSNAPPHNSLTLWSPISCICICCDNVSHRALCHLITCN